MEVAAMMARTDMVSYQGFYDDFFAYYYGGYGYSGEFDYYGGDNGGVMIFITLHRILRALFFT